MNEKKVLSGVICWALGLGIPLFYHALLMNAAVQEDGYGYSFSSMVKYFFKLPWIIWPFLIATGIVGTRLVISGMKKQED